MPTDEKVYQFLKLAPMFMGLSSEDYQHVLEVGQIEVFHKVTFLFFQDEPAITMFLVLDGRIKLFQISPDGQQVLMRVATPGILLATISLVEGIVYPVSAQAADESCLFAWKQAEFIKLVNRYPAMAANALRILSGHVREFQDRYREVATERVERRLARTIIRLTGQVGKKTEGGVLLDIPITRQDLAEMCGSTLFTVSRIISQWEDRGILRSGREKILITAPHGLVEIAEDLQFSL